MKNRIFAVLLAVSLMMTAILTARIHDKCNGLCVHTQSVVQVMTNSTVTEAVHDHAPNNHNLQELAITLEKSHEFADAADYMEGLTAISKRSIYCGDAERRGCIKLNI